MLSAPLLHATTCAGYLKLDLLSSTGGASCGSTPLALCLASFRVDVTDGCTVSVTPLLAAGVYVPGLWSTNPGASYAKPLACPDGAGTAVAAAAPLAAADVQAAIELALERRVYGASYELGLSGAWLNGTLTLTTAADSCSLKYAISEVRRGQLRGREAGRALGGAWLSQPRGRRGTTPYSRACSATPQQPVLLPPPPLPCRSARLTTPRRSASMQCGWSAWRRGARWSWAPSARPTLPPTARPARAPSPSLRARSAPPAVQVRHAGRGRLQCRLRWTAAARLGVLLCSPTGCWALHCFGAQ